MNNIKLNTIKSTKNIIFYYTKNIVKVIPQQAEVAQGW